MKKKFFRLLVVIVLIIIISFLVLSLLSKKIIPVYLNYAEGEIKSVVTTVITKSINDDLLKQSDTLFIIQTDKNTNMTMVDFDPVVLNQIISSIASQVYDNLKLISEKDEEILQKYNIDKNVFYVPSGIIFNSPVLNNLGPRIPVNLEIVSLVNPNVETKVTEYGINNSLVEVVINVLANVRMILPLSYKEIEVTVVVPIAVKLIQGMVPDYYLGGLTKNS